MNKPKISVAMCTYNGDSYIREQLMSILGQTQSPYELIICDDYSSDDTLSIVSSVISNADFPIKVFVQDANVGVNRNFEAAISMCTGEYIALADQDDIWDRQKLEMFTGEIVKYGESKLPLLYSDLQLVNGKGEPLGKRFSEAVKVDRSGDQHWRKLAFGNFIPGCSMVFDSRYVREILPIPSEAILHDWWIALVISLNGGLSYLDKELMAYRVHENNNQGMHSFRRTVGRVSEFGLSTIASNNFLITLRQLQAANDRLQQHGVSRPVGLVEICRIRETLRLIRPFVLFKLGIRRASALVGSVLIRGGQLSDDSIGHL